MQRALKYLWADGNSFSREAKERLRKLLPNTTVDFRKPGRETRDNRSDGACSGGRLPEKRSQADQWPEHQVGEQQ